jgi:teichuronic acid biosynthesis glycosyltransferase TuaC
LSARWSQSLLERILARGWVSWEQSRPEARVLMVTNAWPRPENPMHGIFLKRTVDGLEAQGLACDVLFIRGYLGSRAYVAGALALLALARSRDGTYELVNCHGGETALAARCFHGAPVIASYWGSDILGPQYGSSLTRARLFAVSRLLRWHSTLFEGTTTKSQEMAGKLPPRARRRNWVIPDGVDRTRFVVGDRAEAKRALGWPEDEITVISVGRPVVLKRLWLAERAADLAAERVNGLRWRLVSDLAPEKMVLAYNAAHCLIHTSSSEGSPNVVKEALACDLPVVATAAGDIPDLLAGVTPSAVCGPVPAELAMEIVRCVLEQGGRCNGRQATARLGSETIANEVLACYRVQGLRVQTTPGRLR